MRYRKGGEGPTNKKTPGWAKGLLIETAQRASPEHLKKKLNSCKKETDETGGGV